jgi:hypothetical protein
MKRHTIRAEELIEYCFSHALAGSHSAQENKTLEVKICLRESGEIYGLYRVECKYKTETFITSDLFEAVEFYNNL